VTTSELTKSKIVDFARVSFPITSECFTGPLTLQDEGCQKEPLPAVVFLHGCSGLNGRQFDHISIFNELGYVVFAPSSFARPNRSSSCGRANSVLGWRHEEARLMLERVRQFDWVDQNRVVLAGFSEGGIAAAEYGGDDFNAVVAIGFGCSKRNFKASSNIPALHINGRHDTEVSDNSLCSDVFRGQFEAIYVDTGHPVAHDPKTKATIDKFLSTAFADVK